ncbi:DUF4369 domain-containing protein [Sphingobacterium sp. Lzh-3]|uniref:DUF4369 domain-containing protein n=1 Tax=Sphingobacterium sp. Lzh-3 TaxID=3382150 RepID=UPI00398CAEF7
MKFVNYFCLISVLALGTTACTQKSESAKTAALLNSFSYKITGKTTAGDGTQVSLVDHDNKMQQFVKTQVANGQFVLEGELAMAGFYDIQIKGMEPYTLFVEGGSDYDLSEDQGKFTLTTSSQNAKDFIQFNANYKQREQEEKNKTANKSQRVRQLESQLPSMAARNDGSYEKAVDEIQRLNGNAAFNPRTLYADFILDSTHRSSLVLPYFFKYVSLDQTNYKKFDAALQGFNTDLQKHPYFKFAREKVDRVKDFYENMPVFPSITPMNVERDTLALKDISKAKMLIAAFWKASNTNSKADIGMLRKKESQLNAMGVRVIYFSLDKDLDKWSKSSKDLALGKQSYFLNYNDQATMENDFGIDRTPSYLWINPQTLKILSLSGEDPAMPQFLGKVKEFVAKN